MVYTVFYYATEALTKALLYAILYLLERRRKPVEERPKFYEPQVMPDWGFARVTNYGLAPEYRFIGKETRLYVVIPELIPLRRVVEHRKVKAQPERLFFTFAEAASKDWFKTIEWLAEQLSKKERETGGEER